MKNARIFIICLILSVVSLLLYKMHSLAFFTESSRILDVIILLFLLVAGGGGLKKSNYPRQFFRRNVDLFLFCAVYFVVLFILIYEDVAGRGSNLFNLSFLLGRSLFFIYRIFKGLESLDAAYSRLRERPAQSIIFTFLFIIIVGAILLMMPFATTASGGLGFIDALFTSTSAVCVTGLIVLDTATAFSFAGKLIILLLIQTGGLGIMMLAYFSMFFLGGRIKFEEKQRLLLVIGDSDMSTIIKNLKRIIYLTFSIEGMGAVLLFAEFGRRADWNEGALFSAVFHSVSAFCNAGFSVFSNSLEDFSDSPAIIFTIGALIILGGLSFSVIFNVAGFLSKKKSRITKLALNTRVVLVWSAVLLVGGFVFFYAAEHGSVLKGYSTPGQYLAAFFQSVTLRTAGFNSVPFASLRLGTLVVMCFFMFIGAASGSTAGGIKINTVAVIFAYLKSLTIGSENVTLYRYQLSKTEILKAFTILQYAIFAIFLGTALLALTHNEALRDILFEAVSAFGTVGLSTGVTARLNSFGKIIIIVLMFNGRLGPLTILTGLAVKERSVGAEYPEGKVLIG